MNRKILYLVIVLINISCSREHELIDEKNNNNNPPESFAVKVDSITSESAYLSWVKAKDPENDDVKYDVSLQGKTLLANSDRLELKINNLNELTNYSGEVIAKDLSGNRTKVNFTFNTLKFFLKFNKAYSFPQTNYGGKANQIIKLRDNTYIILGHTRYLGIAKKLSIIKVDGFGNEIWNKMLPVDYEGDVGGSSMKMIQCANSNNIIIGAGDNVTKIDFDGNLVWIKNISQYNVNYAGVAGIRSLIEDVNNNIYTVGDIKTSTPQKLTSGYLTKLSSEGNVLFEKLFENSLITVFNDLLIDNEKLIIIGTKEISGITWEQYLANMPLQVKFNMVTTDINGNIIDERSFNDPGRAFARGIFKKSNGNYIFYGYTLGISDITNIFEIKPSGETIWHKKSDFYGSVNSVKETKEGNLIVVGTQSLSQASRPFLHLANNMGNTIWTKYTYGGAFGQDVLPDDDGGYRILVSYDPSYNRANLYKTDPTGNY